eukprot:TRINITY_DN4747_c0_g1_i1.p1 TRINITY_DN4747_c0_g1~~TRINITY_DN4747_c0_g1_i1.p1  ORF type:complete len:350 (+),score=53.81 TRINITY_DN4747_c0_g1_i1:6-1055(+)
MEPKATNSVLDDITERFLDTGTSLLSNSSDSVFLIDPSWFEVFAGETFETVTVPLNRQLAQAIMLKYASEEDADMIIPVSKATSEVLDHLGQILSEEVQKFGGSCFVKLNTRSPKDFGYSDLNVRGKALFDEFLEKIKKDHPGKTLESLELANEVVCAFVRTQNLSLEARSGVEALHFLTHSERINVDLNRAISLSRTVKQFPSSILIRRFERDLDPAYEFRCFVYKGRLTAISQYFDFPFWKELAARKEQVQSLLVDYFYNVIKPKLPHENIVVDVGLIGGTKPILIELNPFAENTGTALFSWKSASDRAIMRGEAPIELRILESPREKIMDYLLPAWRKICDAKFKA